MIKLYILADAKAYINSAQKGACGIKVIQKVVLNCTSKVCTLLVQF